MDIQIIIEGEKLVIRINVKLTEEQAKHVAKVAADEAKKRIN